VQKSHVKEIITSAYNSILDKLQKQNEYDSKAIIDELHILAKRLQTQSTQALSLHAVDKTQEEEYKNLAKESIESYAQTKESVERINKAQQKVIKDATDKSTQKIENIMREFTNIHDQIESQMEEANETIDSLNKQILALEKSSNLDPLTRTFNRRVLDKYITTLCDMKGRVPKTSILLVDIDDFKNVNDQYGHLAGDRVLIFLAKLISSTLREGDKVFRFGGEEFLVLLNRCDQEASHNIARRIIDGVRSNTLLYKSHQIKITLSMGSTELKKDDDFESFIDRADKALYKAKKNGKDQLVTG
jgi:diguanylate cyclase (GGDEF)-like protein